MNSFTIACTTCKAKLLIKKASLIGQIQACPKCGSMVEIKAPAKNKPQRKSGPGKTAAAAAIAATAKPSDSTGLTTEAEEAFAEAAALLEKEENQPPTEELAKAEPEVATPAEPAPVDWNADKTTTWRNYALIGGGVTLLIVLGVVVGNAMLSGSNEEPPITPVEEEVANQTEEPPTEDAETPTTDSEENQPEETVKEDPIEVAQVDPSVNEPMPSESDNPVSTEEEKPTTDPTNTDTNSNPFLFNQPEKEEPKKTEEGTVDKNGVATLKIEEDPLFDILGESFPMFDNSAFDQAEDDSSIADPANMQANATPVLQPVAPAPAKLPTINIKSRLVDPVQAVQFNQISLIDYMRFVTQMSTVPISIDPLALSQANVTARAPIQVNQQGTTVEQMIRRAVQPLGMDLRVDKHQVAITQSQPVGVQHRVVKLQLTDLAADEAEMNHLQDLLTAVVLPDSWKDQGGSGQVKADTTSLTLSQNEEAQFKALLLFEKLRVARGLSPKSRYPAELFQLDTAAMKAHTVLPQLVTLHYVIETPLVRVLTQLESRAGITFLVDWESLHAENWGPTSETTISVEKLSLQETLDKWLDPMGLSYRVLDSKTIQIASKTKIESDAFLEFYPVGDFIDSEQAGKDWIAQLQTELGEDYFKQPISGNLRYDAASQCVLALLPKPAHAELVNKITTKRRSN